MEDREKKIDKILARKYKSELLTKNNYYDLENNSYDNRFKGCGEKWGLSFIVDVAPDIYMNINLYKNKMIHLSLDYDPTTIISTNIKDNVDENIDYFFNLVDKFLRLLEVINKFENGLSTDDIRKIKIEKILN